MSEQAPEYGLPCSPSTEAPLPPYELLIALQDIGAHVELHTSCGGSWYAAVKHDEWCYREAYYHRSLARALQMLRRDLAFLRLCIEGDET